MPNKMPDKDKAMIKEPLLMEVEAEVDRRYLCEKIVAKFDAVKQQ